MVSIIRLSASQRLASGANPTASHLPEPCALTASTCSLAELTPTFLQISYAVPGQIALSRDWLLLVTWDFRLARDQNSIVPYISGMSFDLAA